MCMLVAMQVISVACSDSRHAEEAKDIVISEIMPSNRTGLLTDKGKPADWIELKNNSTDSISLKGFGLTVVKETTDSTKEDKNKEEPKVWKFPDVKIGAGENLIVFADKRKEKEKDKDSKEEDDEDYKPGESLMTGFKLPKEGGTVQLLSPGGKVLKEMKYGSITPDHSLALQPDSTYRVTPWQSPGFDNTKSGYEAAMEKMEAQRTDPLKIWELMSRASSKENWVELKNTGSSEINLSGYKLSKKMGKNEEEWNLPDRTLQPGQIVSFRLVGKSANSQDSQQSKVRLGTAETLVLTKGGKFVDGVCAKSTLIGGSIGRLPEKKGFFYFLSPSRGEENGAGRRFLADVPEFNLKPGVYAKDSVLTLRLKNSEQKVHYTLDGSLPSADSPLLKDSLVIKKGTVIRSFAEGDSASLRSKTATYTYLPGVDHKMPVINIAVNKSDLYDYNNGIYADGPGYTEEWPHKGANYFKKWTKRAHVEFFDENNKEGFTTDCGLKIFGGFSRADAKKSFCLKFKGEYGQQKVEYDFYDNGEPVEVKDIVLRSGSQDYSRCMVRDEFFTSLMKTQSPTILTQLYRPVALYINGDYFGLYYIREKINKDFVQQKLNLPTNDSINIIFSKGYNEEGSGAAYKELMQYVSSHDMSNAANYDYIKKNVDLIGLIDYKIGEMYAGDTDVGNIRYVRSTAPGSDRKWHFIFYDLDATWVGYKPTPQYYLSTSGAAATSNVTDHNILINRLLNNKEFRDLFLQRVSHHLTNTFEEKNVTAVFDNLVAKIRPEMKRNCERWTQLSYDQWEKNVEEFRKKFPDKHKVLLKDLREHLSITDAENKKYFSKLGY